MSLGRWKRTGFAAFFLNSILAAQPTAAPTQPRFDVVSIRAVPPNAPTVMTDPDSTPILPGGGYVDSRAMLHSMIAFAYNVPSWRQVIGLPNWAENQLFAVAAKPAEDFPALPSHENREQVRLMVRAMLADRFHLQLHTETRKEPVYNLEVAKAGIKIKEVDPPVPPAKEGHVGAAYGDDRGPHDRKQVNHGWDGRQLDRHVAANRNRPDRTQRILRLRRQMEFPGCAHRGCYRLRRRRHRPGHFDVSGKVRITPHRRDRSRGILGSGSHRTAHG